MRYNVRCSKETCKARDVFPKHPDDYKIPRKCRGCGGTKFRIDSWYVNRNTRAESCSCVGYMRHANAGEFPHRRGSKYCWYRKDGSQRMPGDPDFFDPEYEAAHADGTELSVA